MTDDPSSGWALSLDLPVRAQALFEAALESLGGALAVGLPDGSGTAPAICYLAERPDEAGVGALLAAAAAAGGTPVPEFTIAALPALDWVSESQRALPPVRAGRFYLYGAHVRDPAPVSSIPIRVEAGAAFGTGRHESTAGCLIALSGLARMRRFHSMLDMGCGSGVLAVAMAKLWRSPVLAVDNDPSAVAVTLTNSRINGVAGQVRAARSDGYRGAVVAGAAPFDLVAANILAAPLCAMARPLAARLAHGGLAVLSGLLASQEREVLARHRRAGLCLVGRIKLGDWATLILVRPKANAATPSWVPPRCERQWTLQDQPYCNPSG